MERKAVGLVASVIVGLSLAASVQAAGPDMGPLVDSIDFGSDISGVLAIAGALAGVFVVMRGVGFVLQLLEVRQVMDEAYREQQEWESRRF